MRNKQKFSAQALKRFDVTSLVMTLLALVLGTAVSANAQAPVPDWPAIKVRAHALVQQRVICIQDQHSCEGADIKRTKNGGFEDETRMNTEV
jgi:hypothetical protein